MSIVSTSEEDVTVALRGIHDWVLSSILVEWHEARLTIFLRSREASMKLVAEGLVSLDIPQRKYWGPSASVMTAYGPFVVESKQNEVRIQMQSGDVITIVAHGFAMMEG